MTLKWHVQVHKTLWVRWGYGPKDKNYGIVHTERAVLHLGDDLDLEFELPEYRPEGSLPPPEEYERLVGYAWRWNTEDGTAGLEWKFVASVEDAVADAKRHFETMRFNSRPHFNTDDVRVTEES